MSLLRSICCLFGGRCAGEEPKPTTGTMRGKERGDLGQKEAERERASEDQLRRKEGGATSLLGRVLTRPSVVAALGSTCRLVNFLFDRAGRGTQPLSRHVRIRNYKKLVRFTSESRQSRIASSACRYAR
jgi:hypothetical protein